MSTTVGTHRIRLRMAATLTLAAAVAAGVIGAPTPAAPSVRKAPATTAAAATPGHNHAMFGDNQTINALAHEKEHNNPATKNAISRAGEVGADTLDPTSAAEKVASANYVERERAMADPKLRRVSLDINRAFNPRTRYEMAGGCYALSTGANTYLKRTENGGVEMRTLPPGKGPAPKSASRFTFKPTRLGSYLLYGRGAKFLAGTNGVLLQDKPSASTDWVVTKVGNKFTFMLKGGRGLTVSGNKLVLSKAPTRFVLENVKPCVAYPESQIDVVGQPHAGVSTFQEVRGYADLHTHGMAFEFLGGRAHCGKPWDPYGAPYALVDCPDHTVTGGYGGVLETALSGKPGHDPVGWPTFKDWPAPRSLTHEGTYYRWLERAWRGGQRLFVNLLVENNKLCQLYPLKKNSCDDMDSIRLQAKDMYLMQDYIDAQFGGPGKGFYRIVKSPWEARKVINQGKLAVIMGIETSVPFGCTFKRVAGRDIPACSADQIDRQLDEVFKLGVRQMELVNKFDNALAGVAGDSGEIGPLVNAANFLETGSFWDMKHCEPANGKDVDNPQIGLPTLDEGAQDALFGAISLLAGGVLPAVPLYGPPAHCNSRGLTTLGTHTINELAKRHILFDPDHLSVKARDAAMDQIERMRYPGVLSSHSWSTPDTYVRVYKDGGTIAPYAGDSTGFVDKWREHVGWADKRYYWGISFGADINGLGAQGDPRGLNVPNKVTYPFKGINGVTINKQRAGLRVYDINADGVAQYGLYPDWIEDLSKVAGAQDKANGAAIVDDMSRGPEAYLQMWERAMGIKPDSCRNPGMRKSVAQVRGLIKPGLSTEQVMRKVGQPFTRLGTTYGVCAKAPGKAKVTMKIEFSSAGKVIRVK